MGKIVPKHDHAPLTFPEGFLWGAATSAHQVEGNNTNNDWWEWEKNHQPEEKQSGQACDQYNRFEEDFDLAKGQNHNTHRLSLEWSRIEPTPGVFNQEAIDHYKTVLKALKDRKMVVMLTLHHFTNPLWFSKKGGWENLRAPFYFNRFVKKVVPELKEYVDLWITINEPSVYVYKGYFDRRWPPQKKSFLGAVQTMRHMACAHKKAYRSIHQQIPQAKVGIAQNVSSFDVFHDHSLRENLVKWGTEIFSNHLFYKLTGMKNHDFLGLNYYFHHYISFNGNAHIPTIHDITTTTKEVSDMGWEIHPAGIFDILMDLSDYKKPIYITENGLASTNDDRRVRFLLSYLQEIYHAIQLKVDVKGYFHWSLTDNFEWADGFEPRFGLIEIDYQTQKRTPRPSSKLYAYVAKHNGIPHHLLKLLGHSTSVEEVLDEMKDYQDEF